MVDETIKSNLHLWVRLHHCAGSMIAAMLAALVGLLFRVLIQWSVMALKHGNVCWFRFRRLLRCG